MDSFYGGLNGLSFSIKTLFTTYYALQADLSKGWSSPVSVGEFVVVSYGMPQDEGYDAYKQVDITMYNMTYNSTLWQKTYDESANGKANGLSYKLIASMTGSTPTIGLADTIVLDADKDPTVAVDKTDIDSYEFTFSLPQSLVLHLGDTLIVNCTYEPKIDWDESDINDPVITFTLPRSLAILEAIATSLDAGETPTVRLDIGLNSGDTGTVDRPILRFELPVSQTWHQGSITVLDADEDPYFTITSDPDDVNKKILSFALPQSLILQLGTTLVVDANVSPSVDLDDSDINNPTITFSLPQALTLLLGTTKVVNANIKPSVDLDDSDINNPTITFSLPQALTLLLGTTKVVNANIKPNVAIDNSDINNPVITFSLPQALVMGEPTTTVVNSTIDPSVGLNADNVNNPYLTFILPRATYISVGVLDEDSQTEGLDLPDESQPLTDENGDKLLTEDGEVLYSYVAGTLEEGDYFLNGDSGYLYKVVDGKLYFQCSLQVPKPTIGDTVSIDPYKASGDNYVMNSPSVSMTETSTGWTLTFSLPTAPDFAATVTSIGVEDTASVAAKIIDTNTVRIDFNLPRGANIYAGTDVNEYHTTTNITGALVGDLYINTDTGYIFKLNDSGTWEQLEGSILGPIGNPLNFAADYRLEETSTYEDTDLNSFDYIEANYTKTIEAEDIFTVTWLDTDGVNYSYWCYKVNGEWKRILLTAGLTSFIVDTKIDSSTKAYSTTYINSLIGITGKDGEDTSTKTYSADLIDELVESSLSWGEFSLLT